MARELIGAALMLAGALFFFAGTVGLLRFPDAHTRLHALAKADTLGLGFVTAGLVVRAPSAGIAAKLVLIWIFALAGSAVASYLIAASLPPGSAGRDRGDDRARI
jgi:multicomponent Na+:H+ antiporter subunit G